MTEGKPISTGVDLERRDPDQFDPIAWWEGTGQDLGLPAGFLDDTEALKAKFIAKYHADTAQRGVAQDYIKGEHGYFKGARPSAGHQLDRTASDLVAQASQAEPAVTQDLVEIGAETGLDPNAEFTLDGKTLHTLDARLKKEDSTRRKLDERMQEDPTQTHEELVAGMKDNLRYTFVGDPATYNASVKAGIQAMVDRGYVPVRASNYWKEPVGYEGLNTNWLTPGGQMFEVQFHTPDGLNIKEVLSHPLYEAQRKAPKGSPEWKALEGQINDQWTGFRTAPENHGLGDLPFLNQVFPLVRP